MFTPTFRSLFTRFPSTGSLSRLSSCSALVSSTRGVAITATALPPALSTSTSFRSIHTTPSQNAKAAAGKGGKGRGKRGKRRKKGKGEGPDPRIINLKSSMPRAVPAPLRFARNRALRHWTIHRAWLLFQRKEREREEHELQRMYQSMHNACEELRKTSGPGTRDEGYLYRVAMEKKGLYGHNSIPIEYARAQTETPAREPWNHNWTR
ncbi:Stress response protein nst1 [Hypoxylon texense]